MVTVASKMATAIQTRSRRRFNIDVGMIEAARLRRGLQRTDLAVSAGVSRSAVSRALNGRRCGLRVARKLAQALDLDLAEVVIPWIR